ncbi:glycosyltransferase [Perlabentimonas gracilis]|uniref:glycosyltransferase n=1 Tax=Perlabentimonas gracilis TaxID=2715279 RepID=UPI00140D1A7C|nr:glycosyltransferase [Perlabentimonas gracilis]NHB70199.1 glycosyltransferase [Perlabentimonas gracilis]
MKERIFILINTLKTGGAEKQSIYLFNALSKIFKVILVVYYGKQVDRRMLSLLDDNYKNSLLLLDGNHIIKLWRIYKLFKEDKGDVCISYLATTNTINGIIGWLASVQLRIGGLRSSKYTRGKLLVQRFLHNHLLSYSIFNNYKGYNVLTSKGFNPQKGIVIHNCIDIQEKVNRTDPQKQITILSVGRFVEAKDYKTAFVAIKRIAHVCNIKYIVVGQGHLEYELRQFVKESGLSQHVEFVVNPPEVDTYYKQADIYLSTSLFEGLSNSIMEAMSFGLPVIATDVGDNNQLVLDGQSGFLTPIGNGELIADRLLIIITDNKLRLSMGELGYKHIKEYYSIDAFSNKYIELINRLSNEFKA